ncbi:PBSX family phage terminase large subunit [Enterococcus gallinarum]|uniref:PBSX family phage terminase large subunit n=1 Tax=Enterococcus gallinarum TaxID=1353 RepID=UPI0015597FB7|nr:PBSX family phage terminase large subunit [Enterococcus gallinarum]NQE01847.1 PBSX family phage terminase large subunit [Enterococcus gallinarum]
MTTSNRKPKMSVVFKFQPFSKKQKQVLSWWENPKYKDKEAIICDGSVRAGKTVIMSLSFIIWAMTKFDEEQFGMAGKTIGSLRRNVIRPLKKMLRGRGYSIKDNRTDNILEISRNGKTNYFFLFGGRDESSQDLVQGLTASGFFFDEVALMPQSFVNQATARCDKDDSKLWFNCNPAGPHHWFKLEWIDKLTDKNAIRIHFTMDDNPSLSQRVIDRYKRMYSGVFFDRFIRGLWVLSEGIIFDNFDKSIMVIDLPPETTYKKNYVSVDYGTQNATVFKLWGLPLNAEGVELSFWYCRDEYYYSGRKSSKQKTDAQFVIDMEKFFSDHELSKKKTKILLDPSAASFKAALIEAGFIVKSAKNDVLDGIRTMLACMDTHKVKWSSKCKHTFVEFGSYIWDKKAAERGEDKPTKEHDHCMDADRYFIYTILRTRAAGMRIMK